MLYLVATPIGNLADFSFRAVDVLKTCDYILCEDTRHNQHLLQHYQIKKPLKSFHSFNETKEMQRVICDLQNGLKVALISDAGTPLLADPGFVLVRNCKEKNIPITAIPGANAALVALLLSGFPPLPFQVLGFLPKKTNELSSLLTRVLLYNGTSVCYETPHRLLDTLAIIQTLAPQRMLCVAREMTKLHEECCTNTANELLSHFTEHPPRGEIVLLISPPQNEILFGEYSIKELVVYLEKEFNLSLSDAIKLAAELHQVPKKVVYKEIHVHTHGSKNQ